MMLNLLLDLGSYIYLRTVINFIMQKASGESARADMKAAEELLETLDKLIVEEDYLPKQILNRDETSLFW